MPKQVQLSEDAYRTLAALKEPGESFSDVVRRLATAGKDLGALRGLGPRLPGWDDAAFARETAAIDARELARTLRGRSRRKP